MFLLSQQLMQICPVVSNGLFRRFKQPCASCLARRNGWITIDTLLGVGCFPTQNRENPQFVTGLHVPFFHLCLEQFVVFQRMIPGVFCNKSVSLPPPSSLALYGTMANSDGMKKEATKKGKNQVGRTYRHATCVYYR